MKKSLLILTLFCISFCGFSQSDVILNIAHKLGDQDFELLQGTSNNIGHQFDIKRMQYYISGITIFHDSGNETTIDSFHILVNATEVTSVNLGNYDMTEVEGISFHIGVDSMHNHSDPALYPHGHALEPQLPSMHWGWSSGYRFVCMEGNAGPMYDQLFELHGLGDLNYFMTHVSLNAPAIAGEININIAADYTRALEDIEVNSGVIVHGFNGSALKLLENFRDYVFGEQSIIDNVVDLSGIKNFEVFPNPAATGFTNIRLSVDTPDNYRVEIQNLLGQTLQSFELTASESLIEASIKDEGLYLIHLTQNEQSLMTKKLIIGQ